MIRHIDRVLTFKELQHYVPASRTSIWRWMRYSNFPQSRQLGPGKGKIGWLESEVQEWIANRQPAKG